MGKREGKKISFTLMILGILAFVLGLILTKDRAGDWFFRSETFSERYSLALLILRIALVTGGISSLILAPKIGSKISRFWRSLPPPGKIAFFTGCLVLFALGLFIFTLWARENVIYLGEAGNYKIRYKLLGFEVIMAVNEYRTADFISSIFFAMSFAASFLAFSMHRFGLLKEREATSDHIGTMWSLFTVGFLYLILDEFYGIHEFIGNNSAFLGGNRITHNPDDLITAIYFFIAVGVIIRYRRYLLAFKPGLVTFLVGACIHGFAVLCDAFIYNYFLEEGSEAIASIFYFGAIVQYILNETFASRTTVERAGTRIP